MSKKAIIKITMEVREAEQDNDELPAPDIHHFNAASGWLELGSHKEAHAELNNVRPIFRVHPDVLELRCAIYAASEQWKYCLAVAHTLTDSYPRRLAPWLYLGTSLHRLRRHQKAYDALSALTERFPNSAELFYLLGSLAWKLKNISAAQRWLNSAFKLGGKEFRLAALQDKELEGYWKKTV
jgi:predicted Zn-dependent protease